MAACGIVMALQQSLVLPILPELPALLDTTADNASWLVTATLVTGAVATPVVGRLADMFGKKRMLLIVLVIVVAASALGSFSHHLAPLLIARALQGFGLALVPVSIATMKDVLPSNKVAVGIAAMSAALAIGSSAGLPLGGALVTLLDWHWIFGITVISGSIMLVVIARVVPASPRQATTRFDFLGAIMLVSALIAGLLALSKGGQWGWASRPTLALVATALVLAALWVPWELRNRTPLVNVRLATRPPILLVNLASPLIGFALFSNILVTVHLLQLPEATGFGGGMNPLTAGLWMIPTTLIGAVVAPLTGRSMLRFGAPSVLLAAALGLSVIFVGRVWLSHSAWQILLGSVLAGGGLAFATAAVPMVVTTLAPPGETGSVNGIVALLRSMGTSTASAALAAGATIWTVSVDGGIYPDYPAFAAMFWVSAATSLGAALCALIVKIVLSAQGEPTTTAPARSAAGQRRQKSSSRT